MSQWPAPEPGWEESTEGDLDHDLTEEAGSSLDDWREPPGASRTGAAIRVMALVLLVAVLGAAVGGALLAR